MNAVCPRCGYTTEVRYLRADTEEPEYPWHGACGVRMMAAQSSDEEE